MLGSACHRVTAIVVALGALLAAAPLARAASDGVTARSGRQGGTCTACHTGGDSPIAGITGPDRVAPGRLASFTFTLAGGQGVAGGLDVSTGSGSLSVAPAEAEWTRLWNGEITHTTPKQGATLNWTFQWVAPDEPGVYTLYAAGASVDLDGTEGGDGAAATTFDVTVEGCPDRDEDGWEDVACNPSPNAGGGDCDDGDDAISPSQAEACDGVDQDCDGVTDEDPGRRLCDDGNPCTLDRCEDALCEFDDNAAACDDADPCTTDDHCVDRTCVGTVATVCDDGDPCTIDSCTPGEGCTAAPAEGAACDDGNPCTTDDACTAGACGGDNICPCFADADCAPFAPDDRCAGTLVCDLEAAEPGCVIDPATVVVCPTDGDTGCSSSVCESLFGSCSMQPRADGLPCDITDACVHGATCDAGACGGGIDVDCDDGNDCTEDVCDPVGGCLHVPANQPCDDGDLCTQGDRCRDGACEPGPPRTCEDDNPCTRDACDVTEGCVHEAIDGGPCSDGDACSLGDTCVDGQCLADEELECDDDNACTEDLCDPLRGCVHDTSSRPCDDGDPCTSGDACHAGVCLSGPAVDCDDGNPCTDDACDVEEGCVQTANAASCDDGDLCTVGDACRDGACAGGAPRTCDDFDVCTSDRCDPATGCVYAAIPGCCVLDADCPGAQTCVEGVCRGAALCTPCVADDDCGGPDDRCVQQPTGTFCATACETEEDCPDDFACRDLPAVGLQCFPGETMVACECPANASRKCSDGDLYWFDGCGNRGDMLETCYFGCAAGRCVPSDDPRDIVVPVPDLGGGDVAPAEEDGGGCATAPVGTPVGPEGPASAWLALLVVLACVLLRRRARPTAV